MTTTGPSRYPLVWPEGWPRTAFRRVSPFVRSRLDTWDGKTKQRSMAEAMEGLFSELRRMGAERIVLSTNVAVRLDGLPYSGQGQPKDPGAAVYFRWRKRDISLACDRWVRVEDNVWAIAKHIEALRGQERWGVGSLEQAFRGYMALPASTSGASWWSVLGVPVNATAQEIKEAFRVLAAKHHPDRGGDADLFIRVNEAYRQALQLERKESAE